MSTVQGERVQVQANEAALPQNPVAIARLALRKLAETALAPTPENYASEYRRVAGLATPGPGERHAEVLPPASTATLLRLVETLGHTTAGLCVGIDRFDSDVKTVLDGVGESDSAAVRELAHALTASRQMLQETVESSRTELQEMRQRLHEVSAELEKTRNQARIDPLTGFANRRGMEEFIGREIARARRSGTPFSVAILDIDHFKRVNDEHGHDIGDKALVHLATVVKSRLRESDVVCRYGGEEFVVILPDTPIHGAQLVVDRLRVLVENTQLPIAGGSLQIRFSGGVAQFCDGENRETLLKRADEALYAAKRGGRNRVIAADPAAVA